MTNQPVPVPRARFAGSNDTRLLLAGVVAFVALVLYLAVAFAKTHTTNGPTSANRVAPWTAWGSDLIAVPLQKKNDYAVRVVPVPKEAATLGAYGALVPTLIPQPTPGTRFVTGLWLKQARPGRLGVQIQKFRSGTPSQYLVDTTVPVTRKYRHFTFKGQVKGSWVGVSLYVYRLANARHKPLFVIRDLTVKLG